jgi:hypothetical protein
MRSGSSGDLAFLAGAKDESAASALSEIAGESHGASTVIITPSQ